MRMGPVFDSLVFVSLVLGTPALGQPGTPPPVELKGLTYGAEFFPGAKYDGAVATPDSVLGFRVGERPARHGQIEAVVKAIAATSARAKLFEYATTHEGRKLYYLVLASEENIKRLDELKAAYGKLSDPRSVSAAEGDRLASELPALAWMAYCIHGDEMSGSDASLALAYHLAAGTDESVTGLLKDVVVVIDPLMNPDGRDRCITSIAEARTKQPAVDDQSIMHTGVWPSGRMNHYLFDMNRDWLFGTQPETRGRIEAATAWHPHFFMESHEMGSQDTFLFSPPREAINGHIPKNVLKWWKRTETDHGAAFDAKGWRYYTGEWNDEWYPGYSGSWGNYRSAIGMLYEQANSMTDGVRRADGTIEPYRESVHKQLVASVSNITTVAKNRKELLKDYVESRRENVAADGPYGKKCFAIVPNGNDARLIAFHDLMTLQGIEVKGLAGPFKASGTDRLGREFKDREFPAGTLLVSTRQPEGRWAAASMEFDPRLKDEFLLEERKELMRFGRSKMYDITGWSVPLLWDLDCVELEMDVPADASKAVVLAGRLPSMPQKPEAKVGFVIDGADDRSVIAAARLMESGVRVRLAQKPFTFGEANFARGSVVVTRKDNGEFAGDLVKAVGKVATDAHIRCVGIDTGLGVGDLPDLGGENFQLLEEPKIAIIGREPVSPYSFGESWYYIDHVLGARATVLNSAAIGYVDLRRYNVLVAPEGSGELLKNSGDAIKQWVKTGGTLIAIGDAAGVVATEAYGLASARTLPDVLTKTEDYAITVLREWEGRNPVMDLKGVWSHTAPTEIEYPWVNGGGEKPSEDEIKRRDAWKSVFMPQGAVVSTRVDDRSFLTFGCSADMPVLAMGGTVLMATGGVNAPVRLGTFVPAPEQKAEPASADAQKKEGDKAEEKPAPRVGWSLLPKGQELRLRLSGLLWPEAADRLANSAYLTREGVGNGQVILFASSPTFRAGARGTARLFTNAVIYGPGCGASHAIRP